MLALFTYSFVIRGLEAGIIVALIAPLIGIFLVLRRYSLIADTLSHVSLLGVALGFLLNINPLITAVITSVGSSIAIEKLRLSKKILGESALSIFLSGSLALAIILMSFGHGLGVNILNYLFGSIVTVTSEDIRLIGALGLAIFLIVVSLYKELVFITFDEESAKVAGLPTAFLNGLLIALAALVVSLAIPIIGVLLISALIVIPVVAALQFNQNFFKTIVMAEVISVSCVIVGIISSFYLNISTGGTIVLLTIAVLGGVLFLKSK